jgi:ATP-dependent DNA helicase DinG
MSNRFTPEAARALKQAIQQAGGVEVFAIGDVVAGHVSAVTVTCRGTTDQVPALLDRPRAGQIVVHNHPSGDLRPSQADLQLAQLYGEDGVGVVIVDNTVSRSNWVVEPYARPTVAVDEAQLTAFFEVGLPGAMPGWEPRAQQLEMARAVARSLSQDELLLCEAGTGTGKSLAYLVPAALWAIDNDSRVVISTFTKTLQVQLLTSDLPLLQRGGIDVRTAVLQGRNNYLCLRRLGLAQQEPEGEHDEQDQLTLQALADWSATTPSGSRQDLPMAVETELWEQVMSDGDLTLSVRCPHYVQCHYYRARRGAAAAHLVVVNHALLLSDLALRAQTGRGFLPRYDRVLLDEAHHLEDAATGVASSRLSTSAIRRALSPLLDGRRRRGALSRLVQRQTQPGSALPPEQHDQLQLAAEVAEHRLGAVAVGAPITLQQLADTVLGGTPVRITPELEARAVWYDGGVPSLRHLGAELVAATEALDAVEAVFQDVVLPEDQAQPLLDVRRARRRLVSHAEIVEQLLEDDAARCRWLEPELVRGERSAAVCTAPIEVGTVLRDILWLPYPGAVATSATMTVAQRFDHLARRVGLPPEPPPLELVLPSPFDHARQALLGLPRDLPVPEDPRFLDESAAVVAEAIRISDGGAFVLCTSHASVQHYAAVLRQHRDRDLARPVLAQGEAGRGVLLERFRENRRAVLVGTDTFWEGISVRGEGLRLVVIPRIPFRVPTEPLLEARHERIAQRGGDPFKAYSLPEAVLKLRQGYGRLIRSSTDRGVVLLLDRRVQEKPYGTTILRSLPPARRVTGPWQRVRQELIEVYAGTAADPGP